MGFLVVLQTLGVSIAPLLTALGVGGLAVALALQDTLANLFAGVHILASKTVQPGDYIRLSSGEEGYVVDINWRNTAVRQLSNNLVIIPNAQLAGTNMTNFTRPEQQMSILVQVGVGYDSDLDHVERVTIEVVAEVMTEINGGVPDHEPAVRFHTFGDSSIGFTVILGRRRVQRPVPDQARVHQAAAPALPGGGHPDSRAHAYGRAAAGRDGRTVVPPAGAAPVGSVVRGAGGPAAVAGAGASQGSAGLGSAQATPDGGGGGLPGCGRDIRSRSRGRAGRTGHRSAAAQDGGGAADRTARPGEVLVAVGEHVEQHQGDGNGVHRGAGRLPAGAATAAAGGGEREGAAGGGMRVR